MTSYAVAVGGFVALILLMLVRIPIGFAMGIVGVVGFGMIVGLAPAMQLLAQVPLTVVTDYTLSIIPMFILMGVFASRSGLSGELFAAARAWVGHIPGGLALASLFSCAGFAAINGSSIATAATMTRVALPEMEKANYNSGLATGVIAAGGTLGIMIPPSAALALYGIITEQDISKLFMAGVLPGLLGVLLYGLAIRIIAAYRPESMPAEPPVPLRERLASLKDVWAVLILFVFVIGGIYGGFFTVTEASGVGAVGTWFIGMVRRRLDLRKTMTCLVEALQTTAAIFAIIIGAMIFGYFLTITQTTQNINAWLVALPIGAYGILFLIILMYLILGALMDEIAIALLTLPIVFPVIVGLGFDPIWFGVIFVMVCTIGMIAPPVGMNVFVINSIAPHVSLGRIYKGVAPFIAVDLFRLAILVAFPIISLLIPNSM
jgi:C4-dicarboxylate transporter DctM subunit